MTDTDIKELLRQGISAVRAGHKDQGRALLLRVIEQDERNEAAWLWLSGAVEDLEERRICLDNVLAINPGNAVAQAGLRRLSEPLARAAAGAAIEPAAVPPEPVASRALTPATPEPALPIRPQPEPSPLPSSLEFDPYSCPYCGGVIAADQPRCTFCKRVIELRYRQRAEGMWLGWLVLFVAIQGAVAVGEGYLLSQLAVLRLLPAWLNHPAIRLLLGRALIAPGGLSPTLDRLVDALTTLNVVMGAACVLLTVGLALRSRIAYFATLLVLALLILLAVAGATAGLTGLLPAAFRAILAAACVKWLLDSTPTFEWQTRRYNADLDPDLETAMDYYDQGLRYWNMGMVAKAAAHWKVATQLEGSKPEFYGVLARAYARLGYPAAALAQAEKAVARAPEDKALRALYDSLK